MSYWKESDLDLNWRRNFNRRKYESSYKGAEGINKDFSFKQLPENFRIPDEIQVLRSQIPFLIGKKGWRLKEIREKTNTSINILDQKNEITTRTQGPDEVCRIRIWGNDRASISAAKTLIYKFCHDKKQSIKKSISIPVKMIRILKRNGYIVQIKNDTGVNSIYFEDKRDKNGRDTSLVVEGQEGNVMEALDALKGKIDLHSFSNSSVPISKCIRKVFMKMKYTEEIINVTNCDRIYFLSNFNIDKKTNGHDFFIVVSGLEKNVNLALEMINEKIAKHMISFPLPPEFGQIFIKNEYAKTIKNMSRVYNMTLQQNKNEEIEKDTVLIIEGLEIYIKHAIILIKNKIEIFLNQPKSNSENESYGANLKSSDGNANTLINDNDQIVIRKLMISKSMKKIFEEMDYLENIILESGVRSMRFDKFSGMKIIVEGLTHQVNMALDMVTEKLSIHSLIFPISNELRKEFIKFNYIQEIKLKSKIESINFNNKRVGAFIAVEGSEDQLRIAYELLKNLAGTTIKYAHNNQVPISSGKQWSLDV